MESGKQVSKIEYKNPLISVVVPVYNIREYLPDCLDSILNQSYKNIQIIIVNDGSTDNSKEIVDTYWLKFPDKIKAIHISNSGVTNARLTGIKEADGEWIGFVDGDDIIESDMYERLLTNAIQNQADISHCGYQTIVNGGERIHYFYNTGKTVKQDNMSGLRDLLTGEFIEPSLCNKLFNRRLFLRLFDTYALDASIKYNEDLLMNYILFKEANLSVYEDFCPYHYMSRSVSATRSGFNLNRVLDPVKVREKILIDVVDMDLKDIALAKYLSSCRGAYEALYGKKEYVDKCTELKNILISNKDKWNLLGKKEQMKLKVTIAYPKLYKAIYRFYEKYVQRKIYE